MIRALFRTTRQKINAVIEVMTYVSPKCKTKGCPHKVWQDGFCKDCAHYTLQKEALLARQAEADHLKQMTLRMLQMEDRLASLKPPMAKSSAPMASNGPVTADETPRFIPTLETAPKAQKLSPQTTEAQKDIDQLASQLKSAQERTP